MRVREMTIGGADAGMRKGREQELRANQESSPFAISREGECVLQQGQAEGGENDPVARTSRVGRGSCRRPCRYNDHSQPVQEM